MADPVMKPPAKPQTSVVLPEGASTGTASGVTINKLPSGGSVIVVNKDVYEKAREPGRKK